jgi:hypothetical protein
MLLLLFVRTELEVAQAGGLFAAFETTAQAAIFGSFAGIFRVGARISAARWRRFYFALPCKHPINRGS